MAGTTPNFAFPFPSASDALNGPAAIQSLANGVDTSLKTVKTTADSALSKVTVQLGGLRIVTGAYSLTVPAGSSSGTISFGVTFSSPPRVFTQISTGAGGSQYCVIRIDQDNVTTTGAPLWVFNTGSGGVPLRMNWLAIGAA